MFSATPIAGYVNKDGIIQFLHVGTNSVKLKCTLMNFRWAWSKNKCGLLVNEALKSLVS